MVIIDLVWCTLCHGLLCYVSFWGYGLAQRFCEFGCVVGWCLLFICCGAAFVLIYDLRVLLDAGLLAVCWVFFVLLDFCCLRALHWLFV